jgi:membrane protein DedA with SNARE-associated domain
MSTEGLAVGGFFALNIMLFIISAAIERLYQPNEAKNIKKKIAVLYTITFVVLLLSFSFLVDIGAIQALIVVIILLVGTLLSDWVGYRLAKYLDANLVQNRNSNRLELDKSRTIYQNSISYFMYAIGLYIVGFMAKSPIWFLAASIFATSAIANSFFEFTMNSHSRPPSQDQH